MINKWIGIGRLTKEPEIRKANNKSVCSFTLAVQRNKDKSDFIQCTAWDKSAELMNQYLHKGSLIGVEGSLETDSYEKNGVKTYTWTVFVNNLSFLESKQQATQSEEQPKAKEDSFSITDDELPF